MFMGKHYFLEKSVECCTSYDVIARWPDPVKFFAKSCAKDAPQPIENFSAIRPVVRRPFKKNSRVVASHPPPPTRARVNCRRHRGGGSMRCWVFFPEIAPKALGSRWNFANLMGHHLRNFWPINFDRFRSRQSPGQVTASGHGAMTSYIEQPPTDFSPKSYFQQRNLLPLTGIEALCLIWFGTWPYLTCDIASWPFEGHPRSLTLTDPVLTYSG